MPKQKGATLTELDKWARPKMRGNLRRALSRLVNEVDFAHFDGSRYQITRLGEREVEARKLVREN